MSSPSVSHLAKLLNARRLRYSPRDDVGRRVRNTLRGRIDVSIKDIVAEDSPIANLIAESHRTKTQMVGRPPRLVAGSTGVQPQSDRAKERAADHERQLINDLNLTGFKDTVLWAAGWVIAHDLVCLRLRMSPEFGRPVLEAVDPLSAYPGTVLPHKPNVDNCFFLHRYPAEEAREIFPDIGKALAKAKDAVEEVELAEYWDTSGVRLFLVTPSLIDLGFTASPLKGSSLLYFGRGYSLDGEFQGRFDQILPALREQAKLMALVMRAMESSVFAETVVVGEIVSNGGNWAYGPGAVNQLEAGGRAEKLINQMSPQVSAEVDRMERYMRMGAGFPAQMSGESPAAIATGKGIEELTLVVDTDVLYYQDRLSGPLERALNDYPKVAQAQGSSGSQNYAADIRTRVQFHPDTDPAQTVRTLQLSQAGFISKDTAMNRAPEIDSPDQEMATIEIEKWREAVAAGVAMKYQQGVISDKQVADLIRARRRGVPIEEAVAGISQPDQTQPQAPPLAALLGRQGPPGGPQGAPQGPPPLMNRDTMEAPVPGGGMLAERG